MIMDLVVEAVDYLRANNLKFSGELPQEGRIIA
jgi:hypothetical protein